MVQLNILISYWLFAIFAVNTHIVWSYHILKQGNDSDLFRVIWNSRIEQCQPVDNVTINLTRWGIEHNKSPDNGWQGDVIYLMNDKFGEWPEIDDKGKTRNGGVPQKMDLNKHLQAVKEFVQKNISAKWRGLGVIDYENSWPLFEDNEDNPKYRRYSDYSIQLVKEKYPTWNESMVNAEAMRQYDGASRVLWTTTLELIKTLRPGQGWGYYRFPLCLKYAPDNSTCPNMYHNDKMKWLWNTSEILYPSIYFHGHPKIYERARRQLVFNVISETFRCKDKTDRPRLPIFAYSRFYSSLYPTLMLYDMIDLINSIGMLADFGIEGTILWGDILGEINRTRCLETEHFISNILGPYVLEVKNFVRHCSDVICGSRGRCYATEIPKLLDSYLTETFVKKHLQNVLDDYTDLERTALKSSNFSVLGQLFVNAYKSTHNLNSLTVLSMYKCHCFHGYLGPYCQH